MASFPRLLRRHPTYPLGAGGERAEWGEWGGLSGPGCFEVIEAPSSAGYDGAGVLCAFGPPDPADLESDAAMAEYPVLRQMLRDGPAGKELAQRCCRAGVIPAGTIAAVGRGRGRGHVVVMARERCPAPPGVAGGSELRSCIYLALEYAATELKIDDVAVLIDPGTPNWAFDLCADAVLEWSMEAEYPKALTARPKIVVPRPADNRGVHHDVERLLMARFGPLYVPPLQVYRDEIRRLERESKALAQKFARLRARLAALLTPG